MLNLRLLSPSKFRRVVNGVASYSGGMNTHRHTVKTTHNSSRAPELRKSILNQTDVSLSLAKHVISAHAKDTNLVISPLSIQVLLGLTAAGSDGPTRDQLLGFLKSKSTEELNSLSAHLVTRVFADGKRLGGPRLSFVNRVWVDQSLTLKPVFREIAQNAYKAAPKCVDFRTKADVVRKEVNRWADKQTNGLIKDILPFGSVNHFTRLILVNAVYFKGVWEHEFDASKTRDYRFFPTSGSRSSIKVPFMTSKQRQYVHAFDGFKVLRLPYKQGKDKREFSMYLYLPDAKDGLPDLLEKLGSESGFIENHIPQRLVEVGDFRIPTFKINFDFEASEVLRREGVVLPFCRGGLTEIVEWTLPGEELFVSGIFQKAFIEVNEQGTEAAAVTALHTCGSSCPPMMRKKLDFVADHPFLFVIREDVSGVVLFIGQLLNPLAN